MEGLLDRLISVVGQEAVLFGHFLELLEGQQKALIACDTAALQDVTEQLHTVVARSQHLEKERSDVVEEIRILGGTGEDLNVARICEMADAARSTQLKNLRETVLGIYSSMEETRMRNGLLVEQSVEQIRHTMEMIGRIPVRNETYRKQGGVAHQYLPVGVDRRV